MLPLPWRPWPCTTGVSRGVTAPLFLLDHWWEVPFLQRGVRCATLWTPDGFHISFALTAANLSHMADATLESRVPQDRMGRFSTELFERYQRSEKAGHIDTSLRRAVPLR